MMGEKMQLMLFVANGIMGAVSFMLFYFSGRIESRSVRVSASLGGKEWTQRALVVL